MKLLKQYPFYLCLILGLGLFAVTFPYQHDMYIAGLFTAVCICLNGLSALMFAAFFYCLWMKCMDADWRGIFLWCTILQAIGHGIFAFMNWGSWLFLGLSAVVLLILACSHFRDHKKS